jgi:hypothetical protein
MFDIGLKLWQTGQTWATYGMCSMGSVFTQSSDDVEILANDMKVFLFILPHNFVWGSCF